MAFNEALPLLLPLVVPSTRAPAAAAVVAALFAEEAGVAEGFVFVVVVIGFTSGKRLKVDSTPRPPVYTAVLKYRRRRTRLVEWHSLSKLAL